MKKSLALFLFTTLFVLPQSVFAQYGLDSTAQNAGLDKYGSSVSVLTGTIIGSLLSLIGVMFFVLIVYGGFLWMTARGEEDMIKKGQRSIIGATIGLIIVLGSYALTSFVFQSADGGAGGGGGGGAPADGGGAGGGVAPNEGGADRCRVVAGPAFSCKPLNTCAGMVPNMQPEQAAELCDGGNDIVCCR
ncbi:MAG: hypothetical protein KBD15_03995 [Candidatus Magasanikbacteria bacterium]|jgi:hypothetical protein|nr:hypothetical protein [Candidatus Magasanikbacteria bacterium]